MQIDHINIITYTHTHTHATIYENMCAYTHTRAHTQTQTHTHAHTHTHTHTQTHTFTCTHTNTRTRTRTLCMWLRLLRHTYKQAPNTRRFRNRRLMYAFVLDTVSLHRVARLVWGRHKCSPSFLIQSDLWIIYLNYFLSTSPDLPLSSFGHRNRRLMYEVCDFIYACVFHCVFRNTHTHWNVSRPLHLKQWEHWGMCHVQMSLTYERVMSHVWMSHVPRINESHHKPPYLRCWEQFCLAR